jgi:hypothetical protein
MQPLAVAFRLVRAVNRDKCYSNRRYRLASELAEILAKVMLT